MTDLLTIREVCEVLKISRNTRSSTCTIILGRWLSRRAMAEFYGDFYGGRPRRSKSKATEANEHEQQQGFDDGGS